MIFLQQITAPETAEAFQWFDKVSSKFLIRLGIDLLSVFILVRLIYYRNYRRTDLFLTFFIFNLVIFLITFLLNKVEMSLGAAFGLFAVFSMIRYRTEGISAKDMTYLFLVIALALIMAIAKGSWDDLSLLSGILIVVTALLESNILIKKEHNKSIVYDNTQLILPEQQAELLADLRLRTGLPIHRVDIKNIDFLKNTANLTVFYYQNPSRPRWKSLTLAILIIEGILIVSTNSFAQTKVDWQSWYGAQLKVEMAKGWAVSGQYRLRMIKNSTYYKGSYLFAQVDKRLNDNFLLMLNYRLAMVDVGTFNRYAIGLEARKQFNHLTLVFRPMVQYQFQSFVNNDTKSIAAHNDTDLYARPRVQAKYALSRRFDAYIYFEPFFKFDNNPNIAWWQNAVGLKYEYSKGKKINLYYIRQPDYTYKKPHLFNIVGLDLEFTLKTNPK